MIILNKYEKYERFCVKNSDCHWVPGCCMKAYPVNIYHDVESSIVCLIVCPANATFTIPQDKILKCINNQCSSI